MAKRIIIICILTYLCTLLFAGDVAAFVDLGFSQDGKAYVFAQYGSLDKVNQGFAQIYTVDIEENDYIDEGCFNTPASSRTAGKSGLSVYEELFNENSNYLNALSLKVVDIEHTLYIKYNTEDPVDKIVFRDFEGSTEANPITYHITLVPWYSGKTVSSESSFFISVEKLDKNNTVLSKYIVGNPDIKRDGVIGYSIEKIMRSIDGNSLVFVVEKTIATTSGNSIRYMIETIMLK